MFSFRTTPIVDQLDRALLEGRVGVFCTQACWDAEKSVYLYDVFRSRGNLERIFLPGDESVPGTAHISFDIEEIKGLDALVVEIQDAGSRYFPFTIDVLRLISTLDSLENPPALYILDHPNPAGREVEGTLPAGDTDIWTPAAVHRHGLFAELNLTFRFPRSETCPHGKSICIRRGVRESGCIRRWAHRQAIRKRGASRCRPLQLPQ